MSSQTPSGHSPVEVRHQVWESLVSMVKVYAHAASLGAKAYDVTSRNDVVWVRGGSSELEISFSVETGLGRWNLRHPQTVDQSGGFSIQSDGLLVFPDGPKELDEAAIDWIRQIVEAANVSNEQLRQPLGIS